MSVKPLGPGGVVSRFSPGPLSYPSGFHLRLSSQDRVAHILRIEVLVRGLPSPGAHDFISMNIVARPECNTSKVIVDDSDR